MDDPFREIFNYGLIAMNGEIDSLITINLMQGSNLTMFSNPAPLIIVNSNILIQ